MTCLCQPGCFLSAVRARAPSRHDILALSASECGYIKNPSVVCCCAGGMRSGYEKPCIALRPVLSWRPVCRYPSVVSCSSRFLLIFSFSSSHAASVRGSGVCECVHSSSHSANAALLCADSFMNSSSLSSSSLFLVSSPALEVEYSQLSHVMVVPHLLFYMYNNIARLFLLFSAVFSWFLSKFNIIELRKTLFQSPHAYSSASCSIIADLASFMCFIT